MVPEANDAIAVIFNDCRSRRVNFLTMLPTVDFNHEQSTVAGKVRDILANWNLAAEAPIRVGSAE